MKKPAKKLPPFMKKGAEKPAKKGMTPARKAKLDKAVNGDG